MAELCIRILKDGKPLVGAQVTVGEKAHAVTNAQGEIKKTVAAGSQPIAVAIVVTAPGLQFGGGPYRLEADKPLVIEV